MKGHVHPYLVALKKHYEAASNVDNAFDMRAYMKDHFVFYGIKAEERKDIFRAFVLSEELPELEDLQEIVIDAWRLPQREYQYFAMELSKKFVKDLEKSHLKMIEHMITERSWWDTVDFISANLAGPFFKLYPDLKENTIQKWVSSRNMWLNRAAILFQLRYKDSTDVDLLFNNIEKFKGSKEFFIQKAIGWSLREYSKTNAQVVKDFVAEAELVGLSKKEALKRVEAKA